MEKQKIESIIEEIRQAAKAGITAPIESVTTAGRIKPRAVSGVNAIKFLKNAPRAKAPTAFIKVPAVDYTLSTFVKNYVDSYDNKATAKSVKWALGKAMLFAQAELHTDKTKFDYFLKELKKAQTVKLGRKYRGENMDVEPEDPTNDPYQFLLFFKKWLMSQGQGKNSTVAILKTVNTFLQNALDIEIDEGKFHLRVKPPRFSTTDKEPMSMELAREILQACVKYKFRFFTYVLILAAGGYRPIEACAIRLMDLHLDAQESKYGIPYVFIRPDYSKMATGRDTFLTREVAETLKHWLFWKHRERRMWFDGQTRRESVAPEPDENELVFGSYFLNGAKEQMAEPESLYNQFRTDFAAILHILGRDATEEGGMRRKYTLYSFRRFVKTTITSLGQYEYSEEFIGHKNSTYHRLTDQQKVEVFSKVVEPALTYLDYNALDRKQQDLEAQIDMTTSTTSYELSRIKKENIALESKVDKMQSMMEMLMAKEMGPEQRKAILESAMQAGTFEYAKKPKREDDAYL